MEYFLCFCIGFVFCIVLGCIANLYIQYKHDFGKMVIDLVNEDTDIYRMELKKDVKEIPSQKYIIFDVEILDGREKKHRSNDYKERSFQK